MKKRILSMILLTLGIFAVANPTNDPASFTEALETIAANHYNPHLETVIGNFTWEDSGVGTGFSAVLRNLVEAAVIESSRYSSLEAPGPVFSDPEVALLYDEDQWAGLGYFAYGTYALDSNQIQVSLKIFSFITNQNIGTQTVSLPLSVVPSGTEIIPPNTDTVALADDINSIFGESPLDIFITTSRGDGGVYQDGEDLILYVLASEDCYVKLFHIDIHGETSQIFPNPYESENFLPGGRYLKFPGDRAPFSFVLTEPYGAEYIKVVASPSPYSSQGNAFQSMGRATRGLFIQAVETENQEAVAEARVSYTILQ